MNVVNIQEVERTLRLLVCEGSTFEIRALGTDRGRDVTLSGFFTDPSKAATAIAHSCAGMIGIYTTLNPVRPELYYRCADRIAPAKKGGTTSDHNVVRRTRLLIDIDGVPVAGISASDLEHQAALDLAVEIETDLMRRGWPQPLRGDSGNGAHLDFAIDLPADDDALKLVDRVLSAAQSRWGTTMGDVTLKIDTTNKNAARITKIFGTPARKGDDRPERPHRMSRILAAPAALEVVTREQLEAFAQEFAPREPERAERRAPSASNARPLQTLDVQEWLSRHGISVRGQSPWTGSSGPGTCYELDQCPQNADHNRGEAYVVQHASGAISAGCQHNSCTWDWAWLRSVNPDAKPASTRANAQPQTQPAGDDLKERRERKPKPFRIDDIAVTSHAGIGPHGGYRLTDLGNARRFADANRDRLRYVRSWGKWLAWDGKRWRRDEVGVEVAAARAVVASVYADAATGAQRAAQAVNGSPQQELVLGPALEELTKWARDSAKVARVSAMIQLAQSESEIAVSSKIWDQDAWSLNAANGTIDLRDGELRAHKQSDMMTMVTSVDYDPCAKCPRWEEFLERVQPDEELRLWIQRYLGYALTGDVREQCLSFFYGGGSNGKSVLIDVVLRILGDYGLRAADGLVLAKHGESHPTELADLEGKRFVVCSEIEQGRTWAEALIKRITGDQTITARRMRMDFYTFPSTHKLVVAANTRPIVRGTDHGIWRRMRLVPWLVRIPDAEQNQELPEQLYAEEAPGILAWLVRGCLAWQRMGLGGSQAIEEATAEYRKNQDLLGRWIDERCEVGEPLWHATSSLYESFAGWCKEEGMRDPWHRNTWRERMLERDGIGEARRDHNTIRALTGIALRGVR